MLSGAHVHYAFTSAHANRHRSTRGQRRRDPGPSSEQVVSTEAARETTIRRATPADARLLAEFAARTFSETFAEENRPEDMALHVSSAYGVPQQAAELADPEMTTLLAEVEGQLAGYAQLRANAGPDCVQGIMPLELMRFYVAAPWQGQGVAQALMQSAVTAARARGAQTLWLGVWERNERAKSFYRKCGFADVGSQLFVLGTDIQTDRVMVRSLG
jgi:diamine N-acetyltransferase